MNLYDIEPAYLTPPDDTMPRCYWCKAEYEDHWLWCEDCGFSGPRAHMHPGSQLTIVCPNTAREYRELTEEDERDARDSIRMHEEGL